MISCAVSKSRNLNGNELGLKVLTWVKKTIGNKVDIKTLTREYSPEISHALWDSYLKSYVHPNGDVDYLGMSQDTIHLQSYLESLRIHPPGSNWTNEEKLAYWINAYNAFTVQLILDHYPIQSIKDISNGLPMINSPWDIKFFKIGGTKMDLNTIEHEILRKEYDEPRIHFAINCASFSCPKLRNEAYIGATLEMQLEDQAKSFIQNQDKNLITGDETKLSKIFSWFAGDFTKDTDILTFIGKYHPDVDVENKVMYLDYDWSLNIIKVK